MEEAAKEKRERNQRNTRVNGRPPLNGELRLCVKVCSIAETLTFRPFIILYDTLQQLFMCLHNWLKLKWLLCSAEFFRSQTLLQYKTRWMLNLLHIMSTMSYTIINIYSFIHSLTLLERESHSSTSCCFVFKIWCRQRKTRALNRCCVKYLTSSSNYWGKPSSSCFLWKHLTWRQQNVSGGPQKQNKLQCPLRVKIPLFLNN